ncbi:methylated-DNA-[protein]-cysteine S-methyltransferase [Halogranum amylolyticum]|uniref:Methylated-DNA-[protein]-cysteine S-methyltransferase n=1 Tax=Halogranum amylolyticum TaxID=660520 RepID=A0A1H8PLZ3_9EURY|nr:MGMT family protein [Halogranum amylolyticum]SEO42728.1 methylated-DNA-[protein]-cysteine S-methyltransferase [Halogranum amylolyticum]
MEDAGIYAREFDALDTVIQLGVAGGKVIDVSFPERVADDAEGDHPLLDRIDDYLAGDEDHFDDVPVALTVPTEQRRVLDALRKLPYGETVAVDRVARLAGFDDEDDEEMRTVRSALRENPTPIFVPDHRVEGAGGATPPDVGKRLRAVER